MSCHMWRQFWLSLPNAGSHSSPSSWSLVFNLMIEWHCARCPTDSLKWRPTLAGAIPRELCDPAMSRLQPYCHEDCPFSRDCCQAMTCSSAVCCRKSRPFSTWCWCPMSELIPVISFPKVSIFSPLLPSTSHALLRANLALLWGCHYTRPRPFWNFLGCAFVVVSSSVSDASVAREVRRSAVAQVFRG